MNHLLFGVHVLALCVGAVALLILTMLALTRRTRAYVGVHIFWSGILLLMVYHIGALYADIVHILNHPVTAALLLALAALAIFGIWMSLPMIYLSVLGRPYAGPLKWIYIACGISYPFIFIAGGLLTDDVESLSIFLDLPMRLLDTVIFLSIIVFFTRSIRHLLRQPKGERDGFLVAVLAAFLVMIPYIMLDTAIGFYLNLTEQHGAFDLRSLLVSVFVFGIVIIVAGLRGAGQNAPMMGDPAAGVAERFGLTPRETDIARLVIDGRSNVEISAALGISLPTVKTHVSRILAKAGAENRVGFINHVAGSHAEDA